MSENFKLQGAGWGTQCSLFLVKKMQNLSWRDVEEIAKSCLGDQEDETCKRLLQTDGRIPVSDAYFAGVI